MRSRQQKMQTKVAIIFQELRLVVSPLGDATINGIFHIT